jgi:hypothetical protein
MPGKASGIHSYGQPVILDREKALTFFSSAFGSACRGTQFMEEKREVLDSQVNNQYSKLGAEYAFIHFGHEENPPGGFLLVSSRMWQPHLMIHNSLLRSRNISK